MNYQNNYQNNQNDGVMGWDDEITAEAKEHTCLWW